MNDVKLTLELTDYKDNIPAFVTIDQVVAFTWIIDHSNVCLKSSGRYITIKVRETPEEILRYISALKFTSFENGNSLYISKDMILMFRQYEYKELYTDIILDTIITKPIRVKETPEEIEKIIDADCS